MVDDYELCGLDALNVEWVDGLIEALKSRIALEALVVFGSRARGRHTTWSDYDVCVVSDDFADMKPWERMEKVLECWKGRRALEPICYTAGQFLDRDDSLVREIVTTGKTVFDRGIFARKKRRQAARS